MLQLKNSSPFEAAITLFPDEAGIDTLYVVVKATFDLGAGLRVADEQVPPVQADEYWGEPGTSSIKYASEMHLTKPSTDVVLVGQARAPGGRAVQQLDVHLSVAERSKSVRIFGNRTWRDSSSHTPPAPFEAMPLVYERAYGGVHAVETDGGKLLGEERNPVGIGFAGERKAADFVDEPLPNLEDPKNLIRTPGDAADPACFGFSAPHWLPRRAYAGTYDEKWQKTRAPYLPGDFDLRFFNAGHPDLVFDRYLKGGEPVRAVNMSPKGPLEFSLPRCALGVKVRISGETSELPAQLETVLIEPDDHRLCMSWRSSVRCDKKALKVEQVDVDLKELRFN
ncbi:MAG: DUF2169 domain-containing protein [Deferrisomatales bacterium]|nr:DUF2169 domain-containing protein [Deferrisomatales bacterium]